MTTTTEQTTADQVALLMGNDGQRQRNAEGETLCEVCEAEGGFYSRYDNGRSGLDVWEWSDGSAIVASDGGWDLRAEGCVNACWDGEGCTCEDDED